MKAYVKFANGTTIYSNEIIRGTYKVGEDDLDLDSHRTTTGRLWRNRILISPSVELELKPLTQQRMGAIMEAARQQTGWITFWYPAFDKYFKAEIYVSSNYRKPALRSENPIIFEPHTLKFIGIEGYVKTEGL